MAKFYKAKQNYLGRQEAKFYFLAMGLVLLPLVLAALSYRFLPSPLIIAVAMGLIVVLVSLADPFVGFFRKKSLRFFRGRAGEDAVRKELSRLPDDFAVFSDVLFPAGHGDIDFVVVGPPGVFVVECKSHRGRVEYNGSQLTLNRRSFNKNFIRQAHGEMWALKNFLKLRLGQNVFVQPIIVFSNAFAQVDLEMKPIDGVYIIHKDFLVDFLDNFPFSGWADFRASVEQVLSKL